MKKFKKKITVFAFALFAVLVSVFGIFYVSAQSVEVSNAEDFLKAVETSGKIKLTSDIDLGEFTGKKVTVAAGTEIILDLNGYTVSGVSTDEKISTALIQNNGTLIINDSSEDGSGKITLSDNEVSLGAYAYGIFTINNQGTLEVNGGTIENTGKTDVPYPIDNNTTSSNATVTINGGTIIGQKAAIRAFCNSTTYENKIIINDGEITAGSSAVWISQVSKKANKGYLEINGGTIYGQKYNGAYVSVFDQSLMSNISVKITGGTIKNNSETSGTFNYEPWSSNDDLANGVFNLEITGGTFINEHENGRAFGDTAYVDIPVTYTNIVGGSFSSDVSEYVKTGYVSKLVDDLYVVGIEYNVNVPVIDNATINVDKTTALAGEEVTISVTTEDDYQLNTLKVLDENEEELEITDGKFVMPSGDVTISVELDKLYNVLVVGTTEATVGVDNDKVVAGEEITVTVTPDEEYELVSIKVVDENEEEVTVTDGKFVMPSGNVTVSVELAQIKYEVNVEELINGEVVVDKETAAKGEEVTVTVTPDEEYELVSIKVVDENEEEVTVTDGKFVMPSGGATVSVELAQIKYDVNVDELINGEVVVDKTSVAKGEEVTVTVTPDEEYELVSIKVVDENEEEVTVTDGKFVMPSGGATVFVELAQIKYDVKLDELINGEVTVDKETAAKGEEVTVTVTPDEEYELVSIKVVDEANEEVTVTDGKFIMPSGNVTVTVSLANIKHTVKLDAVANGKVTVDKPEAIKGEEVTVTVTPNEEYELVSIKVVDKENKEITVTNGKFVMPSGGVTVSAELAQIKYEVKLDELTNGEVTVNKTKVAKGEEVTVTVSPDEGYELVSIKVLDENEEEVTVTNGKFVMPSGNVTVTVELNEIIITTDIPTVDTTEEVKEVEVGVKEAEKTEEILLDSLKDNEDFKDEINNTSVNVEVQIAKMEETIVDEKVVEEMQEKLGKATISTFFDITIAVKNKDEVIGTLDELTEEIELMIVLPEELKNTDEKVKRTYYVVRRHETKNGVEIEILKDVELSKDGKSLIFKTDKFSTYALAYEDSAIEDTENPATGINMTMYIVIAFVSLVGLLATGLYFVKKRLSN